MKLAYFIVVALITPAFMVQAEDDVDEKSSREVPVIEAGVQAEGELINREDSAASYGEPVIGGQPAQGYGIAPQPFIAGGVSGGYGSPQIQPVRYNAPIYSAPISSYGTPAFRSHQHFYRPPTVGYGSINTINYPRFIHGGNGGFNGGNFGQGGYGQGGFNGGNFGQGGYGQGGFNGGNFGQGGYGQGGFNGGNFGQGGFNYQRFYNFRPRFTPVVSGGYS